MKGGALYRKAATLRERARGAKLEWLEVLNQARKQPMVANREWRKLCIEKAMFYRNLQRVYGGYKR